MGGLGEHCFLNVPRGNMELHTQISNQKERGLVFSGARSASFMSPYAAADLGKTGREFLDVAEGFWIQLCNVNPLQVTGQ